MGIALSVESSLITMLLSGIWQLVIYVVALVGSAARALGTFADRSDLVFGPVSWSGRMYERLGNHAAPSTTGTSGNAPTLSDMSASA
ncbi:hypothetical protein WDZ92_28330 [Nostoc sp. NIES-2111]